MSSATSPPLRKFTLVQSDLRSETDTADTKAAVIHAATIKCTIKSKRGISPELRGHLIVARVAKEQDLCAGYLRRIEERFR